MLDLAHIRPLATVTAIALAGACAGTRPAPEPQLTSRQIIVLDVPWINGASVVCILAVYPDSTRSSGMCRLAGGVGGKW